MKLCSDITLVYMRQQCCVHSDTELVTCGLYPSQKIVQLGRNQDWFDIFSAAELSTDKHAVIILDIDFGCYTAGSHLSIGL